MNKSKNVSDEKRKKLNKRIAEIELFIQRAQQDENTKNLLMYIADLKKDLRAKKYGLVFEEHREKIDDDLDGNTPVLTEDKERFIDNGGEINFLIEGDNLASLQLLEKTHRGKIDFIYIDPPYNTGTEDFVYGDKFVEKTDMFRHSKWLSFMSRRLEIAKRLLSNEGVIFISIDDNEQSQLKLLCDDIFGEDNFIANFIWEKSQHFGRQKLNYYSNADYILCYGRQIIKKKLKELLVERVTTDLSDAPLYNASNNTNTLLFPAKTVKFNMPDGVYKKTTNPDYLLLNPVTVKDGVNKNDFSLSFKSRWSNEYCQEEIKKGTTFWVKTEGFAIRAIYGGTRHSTVAPRQIIFTNTKNPMFTKCRINDQRVDTNENATKELGDIIGEDSFSYPKPVSLIEYLISLLYKEETLSFNSDCTVLDFFAGSGTTGHAVMKINKEDGGKRKFILCTNNETQTGDEKDGICRKSTYPRLKSVIENDGYKASLKYFRVEFVPLTERLYDEYAHELLAHIRELVELENAISFTGNARIAIILTEEELDVFAASLDENSECETIYLGQNILVRLDQRKLFNRLNIKINVIPNYYYKELSMS